MIFNSYDLAGLSHNIKDLGRIFAVQDIDICNSYIDSLLFQQICCCKYTIKYITIREQYCICAILFPNGDTIFGEWSIFAYTSTSRPLPPRIYTGPWISAAYLTASYNCSGSAGVRTVKFGMLVTNARSS